MIFLSSVFGYMVVVIIIKWTTYYENTHCAQSILTLFIDMFLNMGLVAEIEGCDMKKVELFPHQTGVEQFLLAIAFLSVPWMLLTKPLLLRSKHSNPHNSKNGTGANRYLLAEDSASNAEDDCPPSEPFDFAEEMIHQILVVVVSVVNTDR